MHRLILHGLIELRQNYWFWPSVLTLLAIAAGFAMPVFDRAIGNEWVSGSDTLRGMQVEGARSLLTTVAAAVLGVAGVSFSITIVAVSFASGNYGPRLIGNFMRDRTNQVVLGVFLSTFVYCIVLLRAVHAATGEGGGDGLAAFVPQTGILLAMALMLISVGALIYFIHHVPESINIMNLSARIGGELREAISAELGEAEDESAAGEHHPAITGAPIAPSDEPEDDEAVHETRAAIAGYVQRYDLERLRELAEEKELRVRILVRPGEFVVRGAVLMRAWPRDVLTEDDQDAVAQCVILGSERTSVQDVYFLSDELVEMVARALSPGVNDPHTAMTCLDWLRVGLSEFAQRCQGRMADDGGSVIFERVTFEGMLKRSFGRMRQYVAADRNVTLHALNLLADLAAMTKRDEQRDAVLHEMEQLAGSAGELLSESAAREEVKARFDEARRRIAAGKSSPAPRRASHTLAA